MFNILSVPFTTAIKSKPKTASRLSGKTHIRLDANNLTISVGRLDVVIPDELEREFRDEVARRLGMKKGNLSVAVEEAIRDWIAKQRKRSRKI